MGKYAVFLMVLGIGFSNLLAQNSITGFVLSEDGKRLPSVEIHLLPINKVTISDEMGKYRFADIPNGTYSIEASHIAFENKIQKLIIEDETPKTDIILNQKVYMTDAVVVEGTRAGDKTPTTYSKLTAEKIQSQNYGQDMPYLFDQTPSTVVSSDAGAGVGYTNMRIRGVDQTRINVTINGIPLNDPESHEVYWVDLPDFASSSDDIQIQRGVGTSTNGAAAFGGSINVKSNQLNKETYAILDNSFGSFNTLKNTLKVGTGLMDNKFSLDLRLSNISSDGYIDRSASSLQSYYASAAYIGKKNLWRVNVFSGTEKTDQAWYGTPESIIKGDLTQINAFADRNGLNQTDRENALNSGRTYNYYTYNDQTDNYRQDHYQLHYLHRFNGRLSANISGHYTHGEGYYQEFKANEELLDYNINPMVVNGDSVFSADIVRRRWLKNDFYGSVFSFNYDNLDQLKITLGGGINEYIGTHYGELIWSEFALGSTIGDRYYDNDAVKNDAHAYAKINYTVGSFSYFVDLQYRMMDYTFKGPELVNGVSKELDQTVNYAFFNPKVGVYYQFDEKISFYTSYAAANREPVRRDFRESSPSSRPKHEHLDNYEIGAKHMGKKLQLQWTYYLMNYTDQLVLTGAINDVGSYSRTNVRESHRTGMELDGAYLLSKKWLLSSSVTWSSNKIKAFSEFKDDYDTGGQTETIYNNTTIGFSPEWIASGSVTYKPMERINLSWICKYVSDQYLDNTANENRKMDAYLVNHLRGDYVLKNWVFKELLIGFQVNNILDELYQNNGYTYSYVYGGETTTENFYYPQAGRHYMVRLRLMF